MNLREEQHFGESVLIPNEQDSGGGGLGGEVPKEMLLQSQQLYERYVINLKKSTIRSQNFSLKDVKGIQNEDKPFLILNKDSGEIFDIRNEQVISNLLSEAKGAPFALRENAQAQQLCWEDFWRKMQQLHNDFIDAASKGELAKLEVIVQKESQIYPLDLNHKDFDDMTAAHYASLEGHAECLKLLLAAGCNIEAETLFKRRPVHLAALRGNLEVLSLLIARGCDLNAKDKEFNTALHLACENNLLQTIVILLSSKARSDLKNYQNLLAIEMTSLTDVQNIFDKFDVQAQFSYALQRKQYVQKILNNQKKEALLR